MAGNGEIDVLNNLVADPLRVILVHLAINPTVDAIDDLDLAALIEATFPGYVPFKCDTFHADTESTPDLAHVESDVCTWRCTADFGGQQVTIAYVTETYNNGNPKLLKWFPLDQPLRIAQEGQAVEVVLDLYSTSMP